MRFHRHKWSRPICNYDEEIVRYDCLRCKTSKEAWFWSPDTYPTHYNKRVRWAEWQRS